MRTNEKGIEARSTKFHEIVVAAQAGFADGDAAIGNAADQFKRGVDVDGQRLQITIVHAENPRAGGEGAAEFFAAVHFDKRLHAQLPAESDKIAQQAVAEGRDYQQKTIRVVGARFPYLPGIENKILAQHGELDGLAGVSQILQRAAKEFGLCEHRESASASGF